MSPILLLLLSCVEKVPADSGGTEITCPASLLIDLPERVRPGETVALGWSIDGSQAALQPEWEVGEGEVADGLWTVPEDLATHLDVEVSVVARAAAEGCPELQAEGSVAVGFEEVDRVVVLYNPAVEGSLEVAQAYSAMHALSAEALCGVESEQSVTLAGADIASFLGEVQACIDLVGPQVHYLVPVYGVPYKVSDRIDDISGSGSKATVSLDALMVFGEASATAREAVWNPLWQEGDSFAGVYDPYVPFGEWREGGDPYYLVSRIDGASAEASIDLVERTAVAMSLAEEGLLDGVVYVDGRYGDSPPTTDEFGSYESGEWNMWGTRTLFEELDWYEVVWDGNAEEFGTEPALTDCPDALYYAGWYSYYNYNDAFTWAPGAVGGHLDSCSACDIRAEGTWSGSALQRGITATFGAVNEPYVAGMPEYDQLFRFLREGASFGEAAYESTRVGLWMMVFVGDPLYRSYRR